MSAIGLDGYSWILVVWWAVNVALAFVGTIARWRVYQGSRDIELDPALPMDLRMEARWRREIALRRVYVKVLMAIVCSLETAVIWDRWPVRDYDPRDVGVALTMTVFLVWMLTWREA